MRNKKYVFNILLIKYNKYKSKLLRFRLTGRNEHRQSVLEKHIERLSAKLNDLLGSLKKAGAVAAVSTAMVLAAPNNTNAQVQFAGNFAGISNEFGLESIQSRSTPELVDFDDDGDLDLFSGSFDGNFFYFENTSSENDVLLFSAPLSNPFGLTDIGPGSSFSSAEVIDLDGDGDLDFLSGRASGDYYYFDNTAGAGNEATFAPVAINPFGLVDSGSNSKPRLVDMDGDGDLDLITGDSDGNFYYFENTAGTGNLPTFTGPVTNPFGLVGIALSNTPEVADFDNDGDLDLLSGSFNGDFYYFENTAGAGNTISFEPPVVNALGLRTFGFQIIPNISDVDGDGDLDIISGMAQGDFYYFENFAGAGNTPNFTPPLPALENPFGLTDIGSGSNSNLVDLDSDGDLDLLSGSEDGIFYYFQNTSGPGNVPSFMAPEEDPFNLSYAGIYAKPEIIDFDGDGDVDVMSGDGNGDFYYFENTANAGNIPSFIAPVINPFGLSVFSEYLDFDIVDIDGDGDLDIMSGEADGNYYFLENTAGAGNIPSFIAAIENPFGLSYTYLRSSAEVVDLDGDGDLDLMSGEYYGTYYYFENTAGQGNIPAFIAPVINPFGILSDVVLHSTADFVDLDGDGDVDLMSGNRLGNFFFYENITCEVNPIVAAVDSSSNVLCNGENNGFLQITVSNNALVRFSIDNGVTLQSDSAFNNLTADEYTVLVLGNGCDTTVTVPITEPAAIDVNAISVNNPSCNGENDGSFTTSVTGGTSPFTYSIDNGLTTQLDSVFNNLAVASYSVEVEDANGCTASLANDVVIEETDSITFSSFDFTPASAPNASDGEITLVAEGGTGQLTITWTPGNQIGATASGLSTGNYTVTVTDDKNCEKSTTVFLDFEPETPNDINSIAMEDLAIYPNPTTGLVMVSFETTEQLDVEFNIVNTIGKTVLTETSKAVNGSFATTFNLSDLETGVYFLQLNNGKGIVTKKITISE